MNNKMNSAALTVHNLSKSYEIYERPSDILKNLVMKTGDVRSFPVLQDLNFSINKGETVGIIGPNGAGKSTLLRLIAGTMKPSQGSIHVNGRVSAVLELGSGFHPEFSGRENIVFGGLCIGLSRNEISTRMDWVIAFSELGEAIERSLRTYSSGMIARLGFAIAMSVEPDILIIDEALSVGDVQFQRKCFMHMEQLKSKGVTIFFVSHDERSVQHLCNRAILLDKGNIVLDGPPYDVIKEYHRFLFQGTGHKTHAERDIVLRATTAGKLDTPQEVRYGTQDVEIFEVHLESEEGQRIQEIRTNEPCVIAMRVRTNAAIDHVSYGFRITTIEGTDVYGTNSKLQEHDILSATAGEEYIVRFAITCSLAPGHYFLTVAAAKDATHMYDRRADALIINVLGPFKGYSNSLVDLQASFSIEKSS